ncbi:MAG: YihY/virulence factor BrkB family protein [Flavobacteriales bacterium]|nr:YihY/virulence factor BrkB family protein [Flavobacteriales bacterium]
MKDKIQELTEFIKTDLWKIRLKDEPKNRSMLLRWLRIVVLAFRGFVDDKGQLRASALTFYSMLSLVPIVAMIFGVAKGFGFDKKLEAQLIAGSDGESEVLITVIEYANAMLANTKGGLIAGIGVIVLFWSVMKVLGNIETSFNAIWEIKRPRELMRKFTDYLSIMLLAPILIIMSGTVSVFIASQITTITESIAFLGFFSPLIGLLVKLIPFSMVWILLTFIYMVMPNTKVQLGSALFAGIVAGTIFQGWEYLYINLQMGAANANAVYGSFAALPLFLSWLQISWIIVLFGAELSFAKQNVDRYELETDASELSYSHRRLLTVTVAHLIVKKFMKGEEAHTAIEISDVLETPIRVVRQILFDLQETHIISEIRTEEAKTVQYQPAMAVNLISVKHIVDSMEDKGMAELPAASSKDLKALQEVMKYYRGEFETSQANLLLKDI